MPVTNLFDSPATRLLELTDVQNEAWSKLAAKSSVVNPFFEPACLLPAARNIPANREALLVTAEREGELWACIPVNLISAHVGPMRRPEVHTRPSGSGTPIGLGSPLLSSGFPNEAANALLEVLRQWSKEDGPGIVVFDWLDDDEGGTAHALKKASAELGMPIHIRRSWKRPIVRRTAEGLTLRPTFSRDTRRQIRRHQSRLEEALGGPAQVFDRSRDPSAVDDFLRLEASGWKTRAKGAYAVRPDAKEWFRELCQNFTALDRMHLLSLQVAGRTVAMQCCLRSKNEAFFFRVGHDTEMNAFGPGVLVQVAGVEYMGELGINLVDVCGDPLGDSPGTDLLARMYPDRRLMTTLVVGTGGRTDRAIVKAMPGLIATQREIGRLRRAMSLSQNREPLTGSVNPKKEMPSH